MTEKLLTGTLSLNTTNQPTVVASITNEDILQTYEGAKCIVSNCAIGLVQELVVLEETGSAAGDVEEELVDYEIHKGEAESEDRSLLKEEKKRKKAEKRN